MRGHRKTRRLLYDYLRETATAEETRFVRDHLAGCAACAAEAESLRTFLAATPVGSKQPNANLPDEYWAGFAERVTDRIESVPAPDRGFNHMMGRLPGIAWIREIALSPGGTAHAIRRLSPALGLAAVAAIALYVVIPRNGELSPPDGSAAVPDPSAESVTAAPADSATDFDRRLSDYFRRSKALLVGVSNIDPDEEEAIDLDTERRISRSLLREARHLRNGPIDPRSYRLVSDIDQLMLGLANGGDGRARPAVDLIREGIENKNLLFKLRVQETSQYGVPVLQASYKP